MDMSIQIDDTGDRFLSVEGFDDCVVLTLSECCGGVRRDTSVALTPEEAKNLTKAIGIALKEVDLSAWFDGKTLN